MRTPTSVLASAAVIVAALLSIAAVKSHLKSDARLAGKYVIVYSTAGCYGVLERVSVEKLGGREFVVFPWTEPEGRTHDLWQPLESVTQLRVFDAQTDAERVYRRELAGSPAGEAPERPSTSLGNEASVKGLVVLRGQPLSDATLRLHSEQGLAYEVQVDEDGTYSVEHLPPGKYVVSIDGDGVPAKFGSPNTSGLSAEIKPGNNALDFALQ